jgi:ketohexokinase
MPADQITGPAAPGVVLGVGIATVDVVNRVAVYPPEDAEVRAIDQQITRGGNCANSLVILAQLGRRCRWVGVLAEDAGAELITADLYRYGIDAEHAVRYPQGATPTSYIAVSRETGSRTIIHHRDLPELVAADLTNVPIHDCIWAHFEGRNPVGTATMVRRVREASPDLAVSIEIEKPRPNLDALLSAAADASSGPVVLIFSRAYLESAGATDPAIFLAAQTKRSDAWLCVLPWGADGAYLAHGGGDPVHLPASPVGAVVDTLAAGDVFNAALIDGLLDGHDPPAAVARANRIAGYKCSRPGLDHLIADARRDGII